jgi:hypothetical protein
MWLLRSPPTGQPLLCEPLRTLLPTRKNVAENNKYVEKETPRPSRFIADSSPTGNKAGMRRERAWRKATRRQHPTAELSSKVYCCVGLGSAYDAFIASTGDVPTGKGNRLS